MASADRTWLPCPPGPPARLDVDPAPVIADRGCPVVALGGDADERPPPAALRDRPRQGRPDRPVGTGRRRGGRPGGGWPAGRTARRSRTSRPGCRAGRTQVGGRRVAPSAAAGRAERERLAGLDGDPPQARSPNASNARGRRRRARPDTPPDTMIASAPSTSPAQARRRRRRGGPAAIPRSRIAAGGLDHRHEPGPLASGMPAGPSSRRLADLVAGREDGDARPAMDRELVEADAGRQADRAGVRTVPGGEDPCRSARSLPRAGSSPDRRPACGRGRRAGADPSRRARVAGGAPGRRAASSPRPGHGVGARRDRRAGRDADRGPALAPRVGRLARRGPRR